MKRLLFVAVLLVIALTAPLGCNETHRVLDKGTVVYVELEGGFYGIVDDHGRKWDPSNLPASFQVDSLRVQFEGVITDLATFHMWGRTIELTAIKQLD